ncbi:Degenerin deg-1 [Holothuria leucospilota]|uniref:Degenerin deg-1 n=1 Tax=Holothuria leucospilota TaxID=206669 RepID=A0A9Q1BF10_HOLLE|nr:Degenerin deg-1 [Holothuria leucospilota]
MTFSSILNDFAKNTTAHGIPRIILNPGIIVKVVWSLLVSVAFIIFCIQISSLLSNYYSFRTNVELVNSKYVEFPAVTICNFNRMKRSKLVSKQY